MVPAHPFANLPEGAVLNLPWVCDWCGNRTMITVSLHHGPGYFELDVMEPSDFTCCGSPGDIRSGHFELTD
jgi:hypothetical protein